MSSFSGYYSVIIVLFYIYFLYPAVGFPFLFLSHTHVLPCGTSLMYYRSPILPIASYFIRMARSIPKGFLLFRKIPLSSDIFREGQNQLLWKSLSQLYGRSTSKCVFTQMCCYCSVVLNIDSRTFEMTEVFDDFNVNASFRFHYYY